MGELSLKRLEHAAHLLLRDEEESSFGTSILRSAAGRTSSIITAPGTTTPATAYRPAKTYLTKEEEYDAHDYYSSFSSKINRDSPACSGEMIVAESEKKNNLLAMIDSAFEWAQTSVTGSAKYEGSSSPPVLDPRLMFLFHYP